jgi:hypothetical protein
MQSAAPSRLSRNTDGLYYTGETLTYRINDLTSYNLSNLKVNLKAYPHDMPGQFHIDKLDLYHARSRETYAEACAKYLKVAPPAVVNDLMQMIQELEAERIAMKDGDENGADKIPELTEEEKKEALSMLMRKDLVTIISADFDAIGYIGERNNKLLGYIAGVSRLYEQPLAILILSRPGAGKTSLQNAVCKFFPPESVIQYTRLTSQSLYYYNEDALKNKILAIEEEEGMQSAMYSVKTLISSQKLSVASTRTDPKTGKLSVDEYTVNGPVVVFVSTTNPEGLNDETKRRFLVLTIDESPEQTKKILQAQRARSSPHWFQMTANEDTITRLHHNMQRLLQSYEVMISDDLRMPMQSVNIQMRGEHQKFYSLVKSITLLHQYQRKKGTVRRIDNTELPCIYATQEDINLAIELGRPVFKRNVDNVSPTGRSLLEEIDKLVNTKYEEQKTLDPKKEIYLYQLPFTRKELRESSGWTETQIRINIEPLVELGYLGKLCGRQGSTCRYVLLDNGKNDPFFEL